VSDPTTLTHSSELITGGRLPRGQHPGKNLNQVGKPAEINTREPASETLTTKSKKRSNTNVLGEEKVRKKLKTQGKYLQVLRSH
jgi:uncharacterized protein YcgL (UPF0745 family)